MAVHDHLHDDLIDPLRPKSGRVDERTDAHGRAAAAGRLDVLGAAGTLDLQRLAGNGAVAQLMADEEQSPVHDVVGSGGRPLEPEVRGDMEARLGADFGDVRIHDDSAAAESASAVNAHAYTVGSNVVFQRDSYDPSSDAGRVTLAHELTHVLQQRSGPVDGTEAPGGIKVSDPGDRFEREASANAERVMAAPAAVQRHPGHDHDAHDQEEPEVQGLFVQRDEGPAEDEEEVLQGSFVQREAADDEPLEDEEAAGG
ncbi:MAG TPA: DUF4157 domain-containing protein [Microlunatus sp.]|nr:DUF4157 domain-containing protein [Microlunatus sp.]